MNILRVPAILATLLLAAVPSAAQQFGVEILHRVPSGVDGGVPISVMQASDGNFYGVTTDFYYGTPGTVFRMRPDGSYTMLHRFTGQADGGYPTGDLIQARDGHLYGLASRGGAHGFGVVFRMSLAGELRVVYAFAGKPDGAGPSGALMQGSDGALYGVTSAGGRANAGAAFRITTAGSLSILHHFPGTPGLASPVLGLVEYVGVFYGLTAKGWTGALYRLSGDAASLTIVRTINLSDGDYSTIGLNGLPIEASDGNLYLTTQNSGKGTRGYFYRITPDGAVSVVREFPPFQVGPRGRLTLARDGSLLAPGGAGVVRLTTSGEFTTVRAFESQEIWAPGPLVQAADGRIYGVSSSAIYRLEPSVAPIVRVGSRSPIQVSWSPIFGASTYTVKRSIANGQEVVLGRVTGTSFVDHTAIPGQRYFYAVSATTPFGDSPYSPSVIVMMNRPVRFDFDGDGRSDLAVYRPGHPEFSRYGAGQWWLTHSNGQPGEVVSLGGAIGDVAAPGDYDGDGRVDPAIFRPSNGLWYFPNVDPARWGQAGDVPVPGDYDGDGRTDVAVYRPSTGTWYVRGGAAITWGVPHDIPVPADYNGDGVTDLAVFRPSTGMWYVRGVMTVFYGLPADIPVPADYDGDGRVDVAVFRRATGTWFVKDRFVIQWGEPGDVPVLLDRDGDGRTEVGVYRRRTGVWYFTDPVAGGSSVVGWGGKWDVPIGRGLFQKKWTVGDVEKDFDGDGRDDVMVYRPSTGDWFIRHSNQPPQRIRMGDSRDIPVPGDYSGDGLAEVVVFDLDGASFGGSVAFSGTYRGHNAVGDVAVPGDYDGDGATDVTLYRPSTGLWLTTTGNHTFGEPGDIPVPADYDGDGVTDIAVYRPTTGTWYVRGAAAPVPFGESSSGDIPVPADYDGDGAADFAIYRPSTGMWYVRNQFATQWGERDDVPLSLDRDGDGRAELAVYRPRNGTWYFYNPATGVAEGVVWGLPGDIPVGRGPYWTYR
jgi:uncharacterized repeat protein (TIGR03803 family)